MEAPKETFTEGCTEDYTMVGKIRGLDAFKMPLKIQLLLCIKVCCFKIM